MYKYKQKLEYRSTSQGIGPAWISSLRHPSPQESYKMQRLVSTQKVIRLKLIMFTCLLCMMNQPEHIRMPFSSQFSVSLGNVSFRTLSVNSKHLKWFTNVQSNKGQSQAAPHSSSCPHSRCPVAFGLPVPPWRRPQGPQWQEVPPTPPSLPFPFSLPGHLQDPASFTPLWIG